MKGKLKKILLVSAILTIAIILLPSKNIQATSGACSYHNGVNCYAGADYDGSVICNDGWRDSTVRYDSMEICDNGETQVKYLSDVCSDVPEDKYFNFFDYQDTLYNNLFQSCSYDIKKNCTENPSSYNCSGELNLKRLSTCHSSAIENSFYKTAQKCREIIDQSKFSVPKAEPNNDNLWCGENSASLGMNIEGCGSGNTYDDGTGQCCVCVNNMKPYNKKCLSKEEYNKIQPTKPVIKPVVTAPKPKQPAPALDDSIKENAEKIKSENSTVKEVDTERINFPKEPVKADDSKPTEPRKPFYIKIWNFVLKIFGKK